MIAPDTQAYAILADRDPVLAGVINTYGRPRPFEWHDGGRTGSSKFAAMLLHVVGQQISAEAAFTIYDRIASLAGDGVPSAAAIAGLGPQRLQRCGLSGARARYAAALAQAQMSGGLDIENLAGLCDDEVIERLTSVPGIGPWSAQTFLIHNLARPDVLPEADNGIRHAVQRLWHLDTVPSAGEVRRRGVVWSPYRSYAAALLWRSLRPVGELSDPKERALRRRASASKVGDASQ
jgi:3-methyladenine DNA glycosylase/8-oxoguanine DNA glycosylase